MRWKQYSKQGTLSIGTSDCLSWEKTRKILARLVLRCVLVIVVVVGNVQLKLIAAVDVHILLPMIGPRTEAERLVLDL